MIVETEQISYGILEGYDLSRLKFTKYDSFFRRHFQVPSEISKYIHIASNGEINSVSQDGNCISGTVGINQLGDETNPLEDKVHDFVIDMSRNFVRTALCYSGSTVIILTPESGVISPEVFVRGLTKMRAEVPVQDIIAGISQDYNLQELHRLPWYRRLCRV